MDVSACPRIARPQRAGHRRGAGAAAPHARAP